VSVPFVGRRAELDLIRALLRTARRERAPVAALISGEPGSGKTRLLTEVVAGPEAGPSVRVVGFEPMEPIPLAATGELLRRLTAVRGHGPILEGLVFGGPGPPARDPLRIFEAAHRALSSFGPLLIAIDDLQWLDQQSLALVHYLLRAAGPARQSLAVVAATRPSPVGAAFRPSVEAEVPLEGRALIDLGPLPQEDGLSLARAIDPGLSETAAADLWRRAGGSPFWLEALARGRSVTDPAILIGDRLRALSGDAGGLLAALAVVARPIPADSLAELLGWETERVRAAGRELIARGLGLEATGNLRLAHDLIREAADRDLPGATRRSLHTRFAALMEREANGDLGLLREALEHRRAVGLPTAELASRLVTSPQRRLLGSEGVRVLASIADDLEPGSDVQLVLDEALGELAGALGEQELAIERWTRLGERTRDPRTRQRAEIEAARACWRLGRPDAAHAHLERARKAAPTAAEIAVELDALEAEIDLWLDHETALGSRAAERALLSGQAMVAAAGEVKGLPPAARRAWLAALGAAADAAMQQDRGPEMAHLSEAAVEAARDLDPETYVAALLQAAFVLRTAGRWREAEAHFRTAWELSRQLVLPTAVAEAGQGLARSLRDLGQLSEAHGIARETAQLEARMRNAPRRWGSANSIVHAIELSLGDPAAAVRALRVDAEAEPDPHYRLAIHQTVAAWQARSAGSRLAGEVEAELAAARTAAALARCPRCSRQLSAVSAELLARIGRLDEAKAELAAWEARQTAGYLMLELWRTRAKFAIALADGDDAGAASILLPFADQLEQAGLLEELVWARLDLGRARLRIDRPGSVEAFSAAAALAEEIGALSQARLAAQALRRLGIRAWRRGRAAEGTGLDALSGRELEIARLVAKGVSNREIAEILLVSPKTVERHVTNVLAKLGLRNRTELAAFVRPAGAIPAGTAFAR
jgi:DNA-binding CsgD family transcriptional regulator